MMYTNVVHMAHKQQEKLRERVAAVIVHWGDSRLTTRTVESLRANSLLSPEHVLVVENGLPSDISATTARVLTLPVNVGYGAAVNRGIREAFTSGAEFVLVLNNDIVHPPPQRTPGVLETMIRTAMADPRLGCVGAMTHDGLNGLVCGGGIVSWRTGRVTLMEARDRPLLHFISGACFLLRRTCVEDMGGLPEHYFLYWEDVAYGFRLRARGWRIGCAETPPLTHRESQGTRANPALKTYYLVRNGALFVREYAPPWARRWLLAQEPLRRTWALRRGAWAVVQGLDDARAGVTGPMPEGTDLAGTG